MVSLDAQVKKEARNPELSVEVPREVGFSQPSQRAWSSTRRTFVHLFLYENHDFGEISNHQCERFPITLQILCL
jgi:hypothetical protein